MVKSVPLLAAFLAASLTAISAHANVRIEVDKSHQRMSVLVDGSLRYRWVVSTGRANYGTPNGTYRPVRMAPVWFSKEYYNSPMPHSIFFHNGYAIHGSYEISRLGGPASHGCIRLHPANAATLYALVKREGMGNTIIDVSGRNPVSVRRAAEPETAAPGEEEGGTEAPTYTYRGYTPPTYTAPTYAPPAYEWRQQQQYYSPYRYQQGY